MPFLGRSLSKLAWWALPGLLGVGQASYLHMTDTYIVEELGTFWETSNMAIRPYPCCHLAHGPIEAAYQLREQFGSDPSSLSDDLPIEITVGPKVYRGMGIPVANKFRLTNIVEGQFSLYFHFAVAWLYGRNDWNSYQHLQDEQVQAFCRRITVHIDDSLRDGSLVTVAKIGDKSVKMEYPRGEPENPMGSDEVEKKILPMVDQVYGRNGCQGILRLFRDLENQPDLSVFLAALRA